MSGGLQLLISSFGALIIGYILGRVQIKNRKKEEHFAEIKDKVFKPLLTRLYNYYLPIVERREINVKVVARWSIEKPRIVDESDRTICSGFEIIKGEYNIDDILYEDIKQNHFKELCGRLESFEERVMGYSKNCLQIIGDLKDKIIKNIKLKDYSGKEQSYMHAGSLAIFLFEKSSLKGRENNYLQVVDRGTKFALEDFDRQYALGDRNEIEECRASIERLFNEGIDMKEALECLSGLKKDVDEIINEIRKIVLSQDLPGSCKFI